MISIQGEALPNAGGFFELADPVTGELFIPERVPLRLRIKALVTRDQYRYQLQGLDNALSVAVADTESLVARRVEEEGKVNLVVHDKVQQKDT